MNRTNEDKENVSEVRRWPKLEKNSTHEPALKLGYLTPQNCIRELCGTWWRNPDFPFQAGTEERRNKFSDLTRALTACLSMRSKICYRLLFQENWWKVHHCMCVSVCLHAHVCLCVCVCVERSSECSQCPVLTHPNTSPHARSEKRQKSLKGSHLQLAGMLFSSPFSPPLPSAAAHDYFSAMSHRCDLKV